MKHPLQARFNETKVVALFKRADYYFWLIDFFGHGQFYICKVIEVL